MHIFDCELPTSHHPFIVLEVLCYSVCVYVVFVVSVCERERDSVCFGHSVRVIQKPAPVAYLEAMGIVIDGGEL
jgi:hypothetical protein